MTDRSTRPPAGGHAVVLGGSLAGLCAAAALAPHVDRVTLVERDRYPDEPRWRRGVPQARHTHNLLGAGQRSLEQLFPGLLGELRDLGMVEVRMPQDMLLMVPGGWVDRFEGPHVVLSGSRDLLDWAVRRRLRRLPTVEILEETEAVGLVAGQGESVRGVLLRDRGSAARAGGSRPYEQAADLVVDATGRGSRAPAWLQDLGYGTPEESVVDAGCAYATCVLEPAPGHTADWKCILLQSTPEEPRSGILNPIENGRWMVSVAGLGGERPPLDHAGFVDFAKRLRSTALYDAIRDAKPLGDVYGSGRTENRWRHYERLTRWPDRFLVLGDAVGAFNPAYGQGISVAGMSALVLRRALERAVPPGAGRIPDGLTGPLRKPVADCVEAAWMLSGNADLAYPGASDGPLPLAARLGKRYTDRLLKVATTDRAAAMALLDMTHLLAPPQAVFRPRVLASVLRGPRNPTSPTTSPPGPAGTGPTRGTPMTAESERMVQVYRKRAKRYDLTSNRLYLIGQRTMAYKHLALEQLALRPGDTVVDAGCGTGHNLPLLAEAVGPTGRVIGVDLTDAMLEQAEDRVRRAGLSQVSLVQADLTTYEYPENVRGITACFSLTLISEYAKVIERGYEALAPGGRWVVLDYRLPRWWPERLIPALGPMIAPFGGDTSMVLRHPWEPIQEGAARHRVLTRYGGWVYVAVGEAAGGRANP
ncbi:class I SAM-dependent methyltransferase [Streptomyces sp. NPDC018029]|uniref:class I SAM-dependent methyltransferase n=1 Tax=Streptomyces sp. NPDC018029 TaxID=3365032 RepID=UPI0037B87342